MKWVTNPGYHITVIAKGDLGQVSKIQEEVDELYDAEIQGCKIMAAVEASDVYGALEAYAERIGYTMADLAKMSEITKRAFKSGRRK
jgi:hypothetical protein